MNEYDSTLITGHKNNDNDTISNLQESLNHIQQIREKKILKPNWPSFFPLLHYDPSELINPFNSLVFNSFRSFLFLIFSCFFNIFTLTQIDLSCFSFNRSLFLSFTQEFAAIYFCYAFSFRYIYCASIIRHIPYRFVFYQFVIIFWNIYTIIGFCQTGFAGLSTLFIAALENGQDDYLSLLAITSNCVVSIVSLVFNWVTLYSASKAKQILNNNQYFNRGKKNERNHSML